MKRAWTKKVKSLPSFAVIEKALEEQLQPQRQVKRRIFRTSGAVIGLTVSIGTPNLLLTQAAQVPESISSPAPINDSTASEIGQNAPVIAPYPIQPVPIVKLQATIAPFEYHSPQKQQSIDAVKSKAPEVNAPQLQPLNPIATQAPVVKQDVRATLRQHQQKIALEQAPNIEIPVTTQTNRLVVFEASKKAEITQSQVTEVVPNQANADSSQGEQEAVAVNPEANSAWTAKQRLLIDRLKTKETFKPSQPQEASQVTSNINLEQPTTSNQPTAELPAPIVAGTEQFNLEAPVIATQDENRELVGQPSKAEVTLVPDKEQNNQNYLVTPPTEIAQPLPAITTKTEPLTQTSPPVFVIPEVAGVQESVDNTSKDREQLNTQEPPEKIVATPTTSVKKVVPTVNEPIIISSATSEYQVKPGDTLSTIASEHRLPLPKIANFNHLQNPDLLLVDQRLKIPVLSSMKTQANVVVLPPIETAQPIAKASNSSQTAQQLGNAVELVSTKQEINSLAPSYIGVGGSIPGEEVEAKPLEKTALNDLQAQYAQKLQNDVQKLQQKYYGQNSSSNLPARAVKGGVLQRVVKPSSNLDNEPVNPEFRVAQTFQDLKPVTQKQLLDKVNYSTPANVTGRVATAPVSGDNTDEVFSGRQVTPELPPLDPAMNYLPQPNGVAPFNGYIWPARGALTSKYGWRWGRMHRGIDIAAPVGTPIFASAPGVVIKSGWNKGGYGNLVDIQHADGTLTRYAHNYRLLVQPGQFVDQGQQISLMGNTGRSTGPHLHFEVHPGGKGAVNPMALLPKAR